MLYVITQENEDYNDEYHYKTDGYDIVDNRAYIDREEAVKIADSLNFNNFAGLDSDYYEDMLYELEDYLTKEELEKFGGNETTLRKLLKRDRLIEVFDELKKNNHRKFFLYGIEELTVNEE